MRMSWTRDPEGRTLQVDRYLAAPPEVVWRAWSDANRLDRWWGPKGWPTQTKHFEFRVGGRWHYSMRGPDGTEVWTLVEFLEVQPMERIVSRSWFSTPEGSVVSHLPTMGWEITFRGQSPGTLLTTKLTFDDLQGLETVLEMGFERGYSEQLNQLEQDLEVFS